MLGQVITGDENDNNLVGGDGDDVINGLGGGDMLTGGLGDDTLNGGEGVDTAAFDDIDVPVTVSLNADGSGTATRETGFSISFDDVEVASLIDGQDDAAFVAEAVAGNLYFNIHTNDFNGGEIRGQLDEVVSDTTSEGGVRTIELRALLDAAQEPGPTSDSLATGEGLVTIVVQPDGSASYSTDLSVSGLATTDLLPVAIFSAIHLHNAPRGVNGPVALDVVQEAGGDVNGNALTPEAGTRDGDVFEEIVETDTLTGIENILGSDDDDEIIASGGAPNELRGGAGDDVIAGGGGTDIIDGGEGADTNSFANINAAAESPVGTGVTVTLNADGTGTAEYVAPNGNNIFEEFTGIENIVGSNNNDEIIASGGAANVLSGGAGDDLIVGGGGTDIIDGGEGNDTNSFVNINAAAQSPIGTGVTVSLNADGTGTAEYVAPNGSQIFEEFTGIENVTGSNNNDEIIATGPAGNVIDGLGGDDFIAGGGGTDTLDGGAGFDTNSFSTIGVGVTADLEAQTAVYTLPNGVVINEAFENFEALDGSAQDDRLAGDEASNTLIGNDGDDVLTGRGGDDTLSGGLGDDTLVSDGLDVLDGGEGVDTADFSSFAANTNPNSPSVFNGVIVDLDVNSAGAAGTPGQRGAVLSSPPGAVAVGGVVPAASQLTAVDDVENLIGSAFNDGLFGNNEVNVISAGGGNDVVHGFGGGDFLAGGDGVDTLLFSAAPVGVNVDLNAQLSQAEFDAAAALGAGPTASSGGAGADVLSGFENVTGSTTGDDVIIGDGVGNTLNGQGGEDVLIGRGGDDNLIGGGGDDVLIGNLGDDELTGNQGDDILTGGAGADLLRGGAGEDVLSGGVGADVIIGNGGADLIRAGAGADQVNAGIGADVVRGGVGQDILNGNGGADLIFGGLGADRINGGVGRDELVGGSGADVFVFAANSGADTIRDFRGQDTIEIASGASQFTDLSISSVGSDTLIEFGAADIILSGVDASTVGENDFIFA